MKRILVWILAAVLMLLSCAMADTPDLASLSEEDLAQLIEAAQAEQKSRAGEEEAPALTEETMQKGSKGDNVKKLQQRLIELNYLAGGADGDFGGKTEAAVKMFQKDCGLDATGIVDEAMQEKLYADDAPKAKVYNKLNFSDISRDPNAYKGDYYKFSGKVVQVMEGSALYGTTSTVLRIATKGSYDNVVYVTYERPNEDKRILEDDRVTVYGVCEGLHTYETIMDGSVTLPKFTAETVSFD